MAQAVSGYVVIAGGSSKEAFDLCACVFGGQEPPNAVLEVFADIIFSDHDGYYALSFIVFGFIPD